VSHGEIIVAVLCALLGVTPFFLTVIMRLGKLIGIFEELVKRDAQQDSRIDKLEQKAEAHGNQFVRVLAWLFAVAPEKAPPE
jgi:hypothetical protein